MAVCKPSQLQRYRSGTEIESTEILLLPTQLRSFTPGPSPETSVRPQTLGLMF